MSLVTGRLRTSPLILKGRLTLRLMIVELLSLDEEVFKLLLSKEKLSAAKL